MVTKPKAADKKEKKGRVKVGKLKLNKETIKDLTPSAQNQIKGGRKPQGSGVNCISTLKCVDTQKTG